LALGRRARYRAIQNDLPLLPLAAERGRNVKPQAAAVVRATAMRYVYFTKTLESLDIKGLIAFFKEVGLDGADLAVRPKHPVNPDNVAAELPKAVKAFHDQGLVIGLVTAPVTLTDPDSALARKLFEACGKAGVPAIKLGYFPYKPKFDA